MKIVFFGSGAFGLPTLSALREHHDLVGLVSQPDRPAGRRRVPSPTPVSQWAQQHMHGVPTIKTTDANEADVASSVLELGADALVVIAFGQKLGESLLAGRFAINLHASLLPRWRGAAPIAHAIMGGDEATGNSVITLAQRMDAGMILGQSTTPIGPSDTAGDLHDRLAEEGTGLVLRVLGEHESGDLVPRAQDEALATPAPKLSRENAWVDLCAPADECRRRINGLSPWPGVAVDLEDKRLKLLRTRAVEQDSPPSQSTCGMVFDTQSGLVECGGKTVLELLDVQPEGGRAMSWGDYARGRRLDRPAVLSGRERC